ncbi:hypothetical protein [Exiguobacterium flavidum]|uniref:hypothetical protein n=1 Tax=Exiguobacterium flavidum TaxID=2184695 RepID=UPI000DF7F88D|nr:hypothetical protein [Exiguobacterium flavidum]
MAFRFEDLTPRTRLYMEQELDFDLRQVNHFVSPRLTNDGKVQFHRLLREAMRSGDEQTLAASLEGFFETYEARRTTSGVQLVKVPKNAGESLAEAEFNRYYIRALCLQAGETEETLRVYRAKEVASPRAASEEKIGQKVNPYRLLQDLRVSTSFDSALGLPAGANSGLSVRIENT